MTHKRTRRTQLPQNSPIEAGSFPDNYKDIFFVVPRKESGILADGDAMKTISRLHKHQPLNLVLVDGEYPLVGRYCHDNQYGSIPLSRVGDGESLTEKILDRYDKNQDLRIAFVGRRPSEEHLRNAAKRLSKVGFDVEIRELY